MACAPQLVDVVSGVSCCDDPSQPGCGGSSGTTGGMASGGAGGSQGQGGAGASTGGAGALVHRYTFRGEGIDVTDSVGTANGNVLGTTLDGKGSVSVIDTSPEQYVELPSFILRGLRNATFEAWVTWSGGAEWQRIFDFGEDLSGEHGSRGTGRSYLFFTPDDGSEDLFAHFSAIQMSGFKTLKEGQKVTFEVTQGPKGKQASNIQSQG